MRPFEWLLVLLAILGSITALARPRTPAIPWFYCSCALALLIIHLLRERPHWQLVPLYLALLLIPLGSRLAGPIIPTTALLLSAASLALCWALPLFHLPAPTGPYPLGTLTLHLTDPATHRELVTQLWYPAQAGSGPFAPYVQPSEMKRRFRYQALIATHAHLDAPLAAGAFPLILMGPMWNGRRTQLTFLAEDLASHGYVVAAVDHPLNAALLQLSDGTVLHGTLAQAFSGPEMTSAAPFAAVWNRELLVWNRDNQFVLQSLAAATQAPANPLHGHLDLQRIGALGHSFAGAASLDLLGNTSAPTPHVTSAVNMDGWTLGGLDHRTTQPILLFYGVPNAAQADPPLTSNSLDDQVGRLDRTLVDASLARFGGDKLFLLGAQHLDFTDQNLVSPIQRLTFTGPIPGPRAQEIVRAVILSFFDRTLKGGSTQPTYPELLPIQPLTVHFEQRENQLSFPTPTRSHVTK